MHHAKVEVDILTAAIFFENSQKVFKQGTERKVIGKGVFVSFWRF